MQTNKHTNKQTTTRINRRLTDRQAEWKRYD